MLLQLFRSLSISIFLLLIALNVSLYGQCDVEPNDPLIEIRGILIGKFEISGTNEEWNTLGNKGYSNYQELISPTPLWPGNTHSGYAWLYFNSERVKEIQENPFIKIDAFIHSDEAGDDEWTKIGGSQSFKFELDSYLELYEEAQNSDAKSVDPVGIPISIQIPIEANEGPGVLRLRVNLSEDPKAETDPCEPSDGEVEDYPTKIPPKGGGGGELPSDFADYLLLEERPGAWYHTVDKESGLKITFPYRYSALGIEGRKTTLAYTVVKLPGTAPTLFGEIPVRRGINKQIIPGVQNLRGGDYLLTVEDVDLDEVRYLRFRKQGSDSLPKK